MGRILQRYDRGMTRPLPGGFPRAAG